MQFKDNYSGVIVMPGRFPLDQIGDKSELNEFVPLISADFVITSMRFDHLKVKDEWSTATMEYH